MGHARTRGELAAALLRALAHADDGVALALLALAAAAHDGLGVLVDPGQQDDVGRAGDAGLQRQPARLAPLIIAQIFEIIQAIRDQGVTVFLVEQNANRALSIADRGYVLETGLLVLEDTVANLLVNPDVRKVYLGHWSPRANGRKGRVPNTRPFAFQPGNPATTTV